MTTDWRALCAELLQALTTTNPSAFGLFAELEDRARAARRPKPLSLKELALATLQKLSTSDYPCNYQGDDDWKTIRRALEQLDD